MFDNFIEICGGATSIREKNKYDEILSKFCWKNISTDIDPVIPFNDTGKYDVGQLITDLNNKNLDGKKIVKEFDFKTKFSEMIESIKQYSNECSKSQPNPVRYAELSGKIFYENNCLVLTKEMKNNMDRYFKPNDNINKLSLYFCILCRYDLLDGKNQQLSVLPYFKQHLKIIFNIDFELFGSCLNSTYSNYCSLFYDLEQHFGSNGNFFDLDIKVGSYLMNPPFDEDLMEKSALKMVDWLNTIEGLTFIMTIPVWDSETSEKLSKKCGTTFYDMGTYKAYDIVCNKGKKYIVKQYTLCKTEFPYYDSKNNRVINASNTYVIVMSNIKIDGDKIDMLDKIINEMMTGVKQ